MQNIKNRLLFTGMIIILGILPVLLILSGFIPYDYRFWTILIIAAMILAVELSGRASWKDLGIRKDNLKDSIKANLILSVVLTAVIVTASATGIIGSPTYHSLPIFYVFYIIILAPLQELLFRSVVYNELKLASINDDVLKIFISSLIFVIPHLISRDINTVLVAFSIGLIWGWIYNRYPNWFGVALSHSILGTVAIMVGLI